VINNSEDRLAGSNGSTKLAAGSAWLLTIGIILISFNLRAPITSVGPVISKIAESTGMSSSMAGFLTTLPLIAFGLVSPVVPKIAKRISIELTLLIAMLVLIAAILIRSMNSVPALFIGTLFIGAAIAAANVLLPGLIKRDFPAAVGLMMGLMSVILNIGAALGSGISIPLIEQGGLSWKGMLSCWVVLAVLAAAAWIPLALRNSTMLRRSKAVRINSRSEISSTEGTGLWNSLLAWQVTIFLGLQSFTFYVNISWLPEILQDRGMTAAQAGYMVSILQLVGIPLSFLVPVLAGKMKNQRGIAFATAGCMLVGYTGLLLGGSALIPLWTILIGLGGGAGFSLALMFFVLRTSTAELSAELSGMAQSIGYLLAAVGPFLFGVFYDFTGTWTAGLVMLIIVVLIYCVVAWGAAADRVISQFERGR